MTEPVEDYDELVDPRAGRLAALAAMLDVACVLAFVIAGRRSHDEANALAGIAETAWPFLAALAVGWVGMYTWREPLELWPTAVGLWMVTVAGGLGLRLLVGQGASGAFPLVAAGVLAVLLIGWRLLARAVLRRREQ
ncbi:DUF3054 domain-containing protein [Ruania zhangjianzhongii]|uniref:DUF3054 domain-containing protein n=1 Tax=Ruania zhangjianzhongii TaxID=2603206 RepID=UPI001F300EFE|nr:DUF3054 domain-containing protein [Ruania zhangjianzhongii]